jgi:hypothetical protein
MAIRSARQLIDHLAECVVCGKEHKPWERLPGHAPSMASKKDGHSYRSRMYELTNSGNASRTIEIMRKVVAES